MHKNNYTAKTLNGNWHENRYTEEYDQLNDATSNTYLQNPSYNKYVPISRDVGNVKNYEKQRFGNATENWMNFQPQFETKETFKTTTGTSFNGLGERKDPFQLKETGLTKDKAALEEYRAKWTQSNHNFGRTYLGAPAFKKCDQ